MNITPEQTIGSIVAEDYRAAAVLTAKGIDFCCKGGRSVEEVCRTKGLDPKALTQEIQDLLSRDTQASADFKSWTLTKLADHIEYMHHGYINQRAPIIQQYLDKLCKVHGSRHTELFEINREFNECVGAMTVHMKKEELVLFPFARHTRESKDRRNSTSRSALRHGEQPSANDDGGPRCRGRTLPPYRRT